MNLKEAIIIINNLDVSGLKRKFRPKHSLIHINREGEIEEIYKYKENPSEEQQLYALKKHPKTERFSPVPRGHNTPFSGTGRQKVPLDP